MRSDPRLSIKDIIDRMNTGGEEPPTENRLRQRKERYAFRDMGLSVWLKLEGRNAMPRNLARVKRWSLDQFIYNTAMEIEYSPGPAGVPINLAWESEEHPLKRCPLTTFLNDGTSAAPQKRMTNSINRYMEVKVREVVGEEEPAQDWDG
jgi:hypothetical protein